jgi:Mn2+/Fe2+ NRAMP family transporter
MTPLSDSGVLAKPSRRGRLVPLLAALGPGIIAASAGNDAGGIATYSQDGAVYGYAILWMIFVMTFSLVVVQETAARMGAVTGKGFAALIRERASACAPRSSRCWRC